MKIKLNFILAAALIFVGCGAKTPFQRGAPTADSNGALQADTGGGTPGTDPDTDSGTDEPPQNPPDVPDTEDVCILVEGSNRKVCENEFNRIILPALQNSCAECHEEDFKDFTTVTTADFFTAGVPEQSLLYLKPTGQKKHGGKTIWSLDSEQARSLAEWITGR